MCGTKRSRSFLGVYQHKLGGFFGSTVYKPDVTDGKFMFMKCMHQHRQLFGIVTEVKRAARFDDAVDFGDESVKGQMLRTFAQCNGGRRAPVRACVVIGRVGDDGIELFMKIMCQKIVTDNRRFDPIDTGIFLRQRGVVRLLVQQRHIDGKISGAKQTEYAAACSDIEQCSFRAQGADKMVEKVGVAVEEKAAVFLIEEQCINLFLL